MTDGVGNDVEVEDEHRVEEKVGEKAREVCMA